MTRSYLPKDTKHPTKEYAIRLECSMELPLMKSKFYHEQIHRDKQIFSITLNEETDSIQLVFDPEKVLEFLNTIKIIK